MKEYLHYFDKFSCEGLHFDVTKGLFLKVDSHHQIQLGTVYRSGNIYMRVKLGNIQNLG